MKTLSEEVGNLNKVREQLKAIDTKGLISVFCNDVNDIALKCCPETKGKLYFLMKHENEKPIYGGAHCYGCDAIYEMDIETMRWTKTREGSQ